MPPIAPTPLRPKAGSRGQAPAADMVQALESCGAAARRGYALAKENLRASAQAITQVSGTLRTCLASLEDGSVRSPAVVEQLKSQLAGVVSELHQLQTGTEAALKNRRKRLDLFSVTLFGRTMAGKSTLMEILTRGEGRSIGQGAQRTTRDVRAYAWKGLEVTDVPGVAAFEGAADEELAFKSASQADLVLFLITDDAPQPVEAECLARIRRLGKPVLGICNVKVAIDDEDDLRLFLRDPSRAFDRVRLAQLLDQFQSFADRYLPGRRIPFLSTHLRSRFLADRPEHAPHRERLLAASHFEGIEARIIREILGRGRFLRIKSFIDGAVAPMMDLTDQLLDFSARNSASGRVLIDKRRQLQDWANEFNADGERRIRNLVSKAMDGLRAELPSFVEDHYEDGKAGEKWSRLVQSAGVARKAERLQKDLLGECRQALTEVARELKSELDLVATLAADREIKMEGIFDLKRGWNWGTGVISGGLGIAAVIIGSGPLGWAAGAVAVVGWVVSWFMDSREEKADRERRKLKKKLEKNINDMEQKLRGDLLDWFFQDLLRHQVQVLLQDLGAVTSGLFVMADAQRGLSWTLNDRIKVLARTLFDEALTQIGGTAEAPQVNAVARVPGLASMFLIPPGMKFSPETKAGLEALLGEQVWFVVDTGSRLSILAQAIGRDLDRGSIRIEDKIQVAHVPLDDLGVVGRTRVRLAQQLTGLHITR